MRLETWNVRSCYKAGSLVIVSKKLSKYRLDLVGVQEVRWEGGGTEPMTIFDINRIYTNILLIQ
jgi:exonuclease III